MRERALILRTNRLKCLSVALVNGVLFGNPIMPLDMHIGKG